MIYKMRKGVAFVLVVIFFLAIPVMPGLSMYNNVHAAASVTVDISHLNNEDIRIEVSGDAINVNLGAGQSWTLASDDTLVLSGAAANCGVVVERGTSNITKMSMVMRNVKLTSEHAFIIKGGLTMNMELEGESYVSSSAVYGAGIELDGAETSLVITGGGFLSSVMSHDQSHGAGIGVGFKSFQDKTSGSIHIGGNAKVYTKVGFGAGIGGGEKIGGGKMNSGDVRISGNASVSALVNHGAAIGGGYLFKGILTCGKVSISDNATVNASVDVGAAIGGGFPVGGGKLTLGGVQISDTATVNASVNNGAAIGGGSSQGSATLTSGAVKISDSANVTASANTGAAIGGGFVDTTSKLTSGDIHISDLAKVNGTVNNQGTAIGGGSSNQGSGISIGNVYISGGFVTASSNTGADIGKDSSEDYGITTGSVQIIGGSVFAKNNRIYPAPTDGTKKVYKATVPAIDSEKGKDIIVPLDGNATYKAKMVSDTKEHGDSFSASAGAFIYLPAKDSYSNITLGAFTNKAIAKVVSNPSILSENLVMLKTKIGSFTISPTRLDIMKGKNSTLNFTANLSPSAWWYAGDFSNLEVVSSPSGIVTASTVIGSPVSGTINLTSVGTVGTTTVILSSAGVTASALITVKDVSPIPPDSFLINASAGAGGDINESGDVTVRAGDDKTFTFAALEGYRVKDVIVDGVNKGAMDSYTFEKVSTNHSIRVEFEKIDDFPFVDVSEKHWARSAVEFVYYNGIMKGIDSTHFDLIGDTSRAMFVTTIGRMNGVVDGPAVTGFKDTNDKAYYASHVKWGVDNGLIGGISETEFAPDDPLTREQAAYFMVRYAESKGMRLTIDGAAGYDDILSAGTWARDSILKAQNAGLMQGVSKEKFEPKRSMSRAEIAQLLMNLDQLI